MSPRDHELVPQTEEEAKAEEEGPLDNDDLEMHTPLDTDTYGAALFSIVLDVTEMLGSRERGERLSSMNIIRLFFINVALMANYVLQFGMLYFIKCYVVDAGIAAAQEADARPGGDDKETLIHMLLTDHPMFLAVVLILWTLTILIETRKVERFVRQVNSLPLASSLARTFNKDTDEDGNVTWEIKGLTRFIWLLITLCIVLPKICIVLCLFVLGFQWLASTESPADLILNALALEFVVHIDEQLYEALMPKCVKDQLVVVSLTTFKKVYGTPEEEIAAVVRSEWASYKRSTFYALMPIAISAVTIYYMQCALYAKESDQTIIEYIRSA